MFEDYIAKLKQGKQLIVRYNDKCEDCLGNWWLEELYCYDNQSKIYRCYYPVSSFDKIFYTIHSEDEMNFLLKEVLTAYLNLKIGSFRLIEESVHMTEQLKEILNELSKEQLIYLIEQFYHSQFQISEVCVNESKQHISSEKAVEKIRKYLYDIPNTYNVDNFKAQIDLKMGKITVDEYRKTLELD